MKMSRADTAETRKRIVAVASRLFLERGLAATGVADVMRAAGMTQGGFYRHFASKDQLVAEANRAANARLFAHYDAAVAGMAPEAAMLTIVDLYLAQSQQQPDAVLCPLAKLGSELRHADVHIRAVAMEGYQQLQSAFAGMAQALGIAGHQGLASTIVATIVGAVTLSQLGADATVARGILDNARATVATLLRDMQRQ